MPNRIFKFIGEGPQYYRAIKRDYEKSFIAKVLSHSVEDILCDRNFIFPLSEVIDYMEIIDEN